MRHPTLALLSVGWLALPAVADGPKPVAPQFVGVGRMAPDLAATDVAGKPFKLSGLVAGRKAVVVALTSTSCPVSRKYLPVLARLEQEYGPKGVGFVFLNPIATDKPDDIRKAVAAQKLTGPYLHDPDGSLAKSLGAASTGDVFLLDARRTVAYRGAVDDQYSVGSSLDAPRRRFLADALDAVLAGREVAIPATEAPGCALDLSAAKAPPAAAVTYHGRVSRIVQRHCLECHRTGGAGPFPLGTYAEVAAHKGMIRKVVERGIMPPWFAAPPAEGEHSPWVNDRSLAAADKADLLAWLANGTPEGAPADAPLPRTFPKDWAIGKPDLIVPIPKPIRVKAEGTMPYQDVVAETGLTEDRWVQAVEVRPTAPEVVHHVLMFREDDAATGLLARLFEGGEDRLGYFAAYVPGTTHQVFPDGFAKKLPKGGKIRFQIHYTPNGTATEDQLEVGFVFAKKPPRHELRVVVVANHGIRIPPMAEDHPETAALWAPADAVITSFVPHLHVRGKSCRFELTRPGGKAVTLLDVPRYDFNWQLRYELAEPVAVPRGSVLRFSARFDNSPKNPANPDPSQTVRWGRQTSDEMLTGYVEYYLPNEPVKP